MTKPQLELGPGDADMEQPGQEPSDKLILTLSLLVFLKCNMGRILLPAS